jgi:hypothetical protein
MDGQMWNRVMNKLVAGLSAKTGPRAVIVSKMTFKPSFRLVRNLSESRRRSGRTSWSDKQNIFISLCEPRLMKIPASLKRESMIRQPHHAVTLDLSQSECPTATPGTTKKSIFTAIGELHTRRIPGFLRNSIPLWFPIFTTVILFLFFTGISSGANIKVIPSVLKVSPGGTFYIDIVAENIPQPGLGAVQFRLNVNAPGTEVTGVPDTSQGKPAEISVATPLVTGTAVPGSSEIGDFFLNAAGPHGILLMDNDLFGSGGGLYSFAHTNGAILPEGSGSVARFHFAVGKDAAAENIHILLSEIMLLEAGTEYIVESNTGAIIELRCMTTVPNLLGLSQSGAQTALQQAGLQMGNIYEVDNTAGLHSLDTVLVQSHAAGTAVLCETPVDLAINIPPAGVSNLTAVDKSGDESGSVMLSWTPSVSTDTAGYRIYLFSDTQVLLKDISGSAAAGAEVTGLNNGEVSQLKVTVYDNSGNENQGTIVSAIPLDDVAPRVLVSGVTAGAFYTSDVLPVITVQDVNLFSQEATHNGTAYTGGMISTEGNHLLTITATDTSGNSTTREINFTIDKTPPVTTLTAGEPKHSGSSLFVSGITRFTLTAADNLSGVKQSEFRVNTGEWKKYSSPFALGSEGFSADGPYTIDYRSTDNALHLEAHGSVSVMLDNTPPSVNAGEDITVFAEPDGMKTITLSAAVSDGIGYDPSPSVRWFENGVELSEGEELTHTFTIGSHVLLLKAADHLGNEAVDEATVTVARRQAQLEFTGDSVVEWSDSAVMKVQLRDVTDGQDPVAFPGHGSVVFRIIHNGIEEHRYSVEITGEKESASISHLFNDPAMVPGDEYLITAEFTDPAGIYYAAPIEVSLTLLPEKGGLEYSGDRILTVNDEGVFLQATLFQEEEDETEGQLIDFDNGFNQAWVQFEIYKSDQLPEVDVPYFTPEPVRIINSQLHRGVGVGGIFVPLSDLGPGGGDYMLNVKITGQVYISAYPVESTLTVYTPDGRFMNGGGFITDPANVMKNNFSFNFKFDKQHKAKGEFISTIEDRSAGIRVEMKSSLLEAIGFMPGDPPGTPTGIAQGKCYVEIYDLKTGDYLEGEDSLNFVLIIEDNGTPGKGADTFLLELRHSDGVPYKYGFMEEKAYIQGGNIVVH